MVRFASSREGAAVDRSELPEGIPPANSSLAGDDPSAEKSAKTKPSFAGPDTASAAFRSAPEAVPPGRSHFAQTADDNNGAGQGGGRRPFKVQPTQLFIMIMLAGLLTALAVIVMANAGSSLPLCSEQPSWNQHNCRAG